MIKMKVVLLCSLFALALPALAQETILQRIYTEGGGTPRYEFPGSLFALDSSIKDAPSHLIGNWWFVGVGYDFRDSGWELGGQLNRQVSAGPGNWKRVTGNAFIDQYDPTASGTTNLRISSFTLNVTKEFLRRRRFSPYLMAGGGARGKLNVSFKGTATATDPQSGQAFQVPATDQVQQHIPIITLGGGFRIKVFRGLAFGPGWGWSTGFSKPLFPLVTMHFNPFQLIERNR
jgi:opacity protein-like surface antigen